MSRFSADDRVHMEEYISQIEENVAGEKMSPVERLRIIERFREADRALMRLGSMEHNSRAIRVSVREILKEPKKAILACLANVAKYGCDNVMPFAEPHIIGPEEMGTKVVYPEQSSAILKEFAVKQPKDVAELEVPDPYRDGKLPMVLDIVRFVQERIGDKIVVTQPLDGPFGLCGDLRGYRTLLKDLILNPEMVHELMSICTDAAIAITRAVRETGAITVPFDAMSAPEYIGKKFYMEFVFPYQKRMCQALLPSGTYLGIDGDCTEILEEYAGTGATGIHIERPTSFAEAKRLIGKKTVLMMSPDLTKPMISGVPKEIKSIVRDVIKVGAPGGGFMIASGVVPVDAPFRNVSAFVEAVKEYGKYPIQL